jgi:hypothetical protein
VRLFAREIRTRSIASGIPGLHACGHRRSGVARDRRSLPAASPWSTRRPLHGLFPLGLDGSVGDPLPDRPRPHRSRQDGDGWLMPEECVGALENIMFCGQEPNLTEQRPWSCAALSS